MSKMFKGLTAPHVAERLMAVGWPSRPAETMAAFMTGDSIEPPSWPDLTDLPAARHVGRKPFSPDLGPGDERDGLRPSKRDDGEDGGSRSGG